MKNTTVKRLLAMFLSALIVVTLLCGCSASAGKENYSDMVPGGIGDVGGVADAIGTDLDIDTVSVENRKLIKTVEMWAQTKTFDKSVETINAAIKEAGGYVQQQAYLTDNDEVRTIKMTLRIPAEKLDGFLASLNKSVNVTSQSSKVNDVTDEYVDVESHIASLEAEQTSLLAMLEKAEKLDDIIAIQGRLTEVRGKLESYKARKKNYDTLIAYSTIDLYLDEVERETPADPSFWDDAGAAFGDGWDALVGMLRGICIFFIGASPFLAVMGIIAVIVLIIVKKSCKARRKKREAQNKTEE